MCLSLDFIELVNLIGPEVRSLFTFATTNSLLFSRLDWCDSGLWELIPKMLVGCVLLGIVCRLQRWMKFGQDKTRQDFENGVWSGFWSWILVSWWYNSKEVPLVSTQPLDRCAFDTVWKIKHTTTHEKPLQHKLQNQCVYSTGWSCRGSLTSIRWHRVRAVHIVPRWAHHLR